VIKRTKFYTNCASYILALLPRRSRRTANSKPGASMAVDSDSAQGMLGLTRTGNGACLRLSATRKYASTAAYAKTVRIPRETSDYLAGTELASILSLAPELEVVPNQNAMHPVHAVPSDPSIISRGGEFTTESSYSIAPSTPKNPNVMM